MSFENNTFSGFGEEIGEFNICITVEDPYNETAQSCFILSILNQVPVFYDIDDQSVYIDQLWIF